MERLEDAQQRLAALTSERESIGRRAYGVQQARDAAWAEIDADAESTQRERDLVAGEIPADLLTLYEKIRGTSGGIGAAALRQRRCEGCRLELDPMSLVQIRSAPPDAVIRCEECRRILVRTPESGL